MLSTAGGFSAQEANNTERTHMGFYRHAEENRLWKISSTPEELNYNDAIWNTCCEFQSMVMLCYYKFVINELTK